jgi:hypothetical protein
MGSPHHLREMPDARGRFVKGERSSPATEFKTGQHWRPHQVFRGRDYLQREYVEKGRSAADIGREFGVGISAIQFWMRRHGIRGRTISEVRRLKRWGAAGPANPMFGRRPPSWRGGVTPERQALYSSPEWAAAVLAVRQRDGGVCRRCGAKPSGRAEARRFFHIHHLVSFAVRELRCDPENLVQLCWSCHGFVHSRRNVAREFIKEGGDAG